MAAVRFATVRDLYLAFPSAQSDVGAEPSDEGALAFLRARIDAGAWAQAIAFCAYLLPRREAVWWGCQTLRRMRPSLDASETDTLDIVEAWVRDPEEARRRAALDRGNAGDPRSPATWMAFAAGWSGGSVVAPEHGVAPAPPHQTARAVRAALTIALAHVRRADVPDTLRPCLESALALASGARKR